MLILKEDNNVEVELKYYQVNLELLNLKRLRQYKQA